MYIVYCYLNRTYIYSVYSYIFWKPESYTSVFTLCWGGVYCTNQSEVQRYLSCKTVKIAQQAVYLNVICLNLILMLAFFAGIVAYAYFQECDTWSMGWVGNSDQTMPYLAVKILQDWPGPTGLYVAGVYAGSLSTISSGINSTVPTSNIPEAWLSIDPQVFDLTPGC